MARACIVGWAHTPFGKLEDPDVESLMARVSGEALTHAGVGPEDVDGIYVGVMNNGFSKQGFEAAQVALSQPALAYVPATRLENACATGSAAIYSALDFIESGRGRIALVVGAEKMTAKSVVETSDILLSASYRKEEADIDGGFAGVFGRIAQNYFQRYGDRSEELARISAKNHKNGVANPYAQMRRDFGFEFCNVVSDKNPYVAAPLRRTDCSLISDGAAALVVADEETAERLQQAIAFRTRQHVNDILPLSRRDPTAFAGARMAWEKARAGPASPWTISISSRPMTASLSLNSSNTKRWDWRPRRRLSRRSGRDCREGRPPADQPFRRSQSKGHPIGATGVSMHVMACLQLMNEAGDMQIPDAKLAGVFNMGGAAVANYVSILERRK